MNQKFINDHSVNEVKITKIIKITACGFHAWCESNVGKIRKPINALVKLPCWFDFKGLPRPTEEIKEIYFEKWYKRLWNWILNWIKSTRTKLSS